MALKSQLSNTLTIQYTNNKSISYKTISYKPISYKPTIFTIIVPTPLPNTIEYSNQIHMILRQVKKKNNICEINKMSLYRLVLQKQLFEYLLKLSIYI